MTKHHVKNTLQNDSGQVVQPWRYECIDVPDIRLEPRLLVRVVIAKVTSTNDALQSTLEAIPVYQHDDVDQEKARAFDCRTWIQAALEGLKEMVAGLGEWDSIHRQSVEYVECRMGGKH